MATNLYCSSYSNGSSQDVPEVVVPMALTPETWGQGQGLNRQILDSSDDCIKVLDLEGRILFMSRGGQVLLGIHDITSFLNTDWTQFWEGADQQAAMEAIARARAGEVYTFQGYRPTLNGDPKWWDIKVSPIHNTEGQVEQLLCISRDITERKRIEDECHQDQERLRKSEERLSAIYSQAVVGLSEISLDGHFQRVNDELCRMLGRSRQELLTTSVSDVTHPDDVSKSLEALKQLVKTGQPISFDKRYLRSDGTIVWVNSSLTRLSDEQGHPQAILAVTVDLSDRVRVENERKQAEQMSRRAAELDAFRVSLADALRPLAEPVEIQATASRLLGKFLGVSRVAYFEVRGSDYVVERDYANGVDALAGGYPVDSFGPKLLAAYRRGCPVSVSDVQADSNLSPEQRSAYAVIQIGAYIGIPLLKGGGFVAGLTVHMAEPRVWRSDEVSLVEEVAEHTWAAVERARAEAALLESEQRFRLMADTVPQMIWITDIEGRVEFFNKQWSNYTGVAYEPTTAAEVAASFVHPEDGDRTIAVFNEARRSGGVFSVEHRIRSAAGAYRWFLVRAEPYRDLQTGEITRWFGSSVDIHDRKRLEANLAFLAEIMADFAPLKTADEIMQMTCARTAAYFGLSRCLLVEINHAMHQAEVVYDFGADDLPRLIGTYPITDFHTEDEMRALAAGQAIVINDVADGSRPPEAIDRFAQLRIGALVNTPHISNGQWKFVFSAMQMKPRVWLSDEIELLQELSARVWLRIERARSEFALQDSESRFRMMVESAKDFAIFTADLKGYITSWNPGAQRLLGYEETEIVGQYGGIIFTPEDLTQEEDVKEIQKALQSGRAENERWHISKNGSRFWASGLMMTLRDDVGQLQGFLKILRDMTTQKQAEAEREQLLQQEQAARAEAEQANRIKDEFLAVLSHELRSPLNPILGWSNLLINRKLNEAQIAQALVTIQRNAKLQSELIEDLLDVSRILRGKLSLNVASVNPVTIIRAAMETVRLAAEAKSIQIEADLEPDVGLVWGDSTRLQQVIWNLLSNAVKFTPEEGRVNIRLEQVGNQEWTMGNGKPQNHSPLPTPYPAPYAQFTVTDTGQGIASDFLPYVFDYFRQADGATTRKFGGLGLGLAIVRHLVELHGGTVSVESAGIGMGATFTVRLPLRSTQTEDSQDNYLSEPFFNLNGIQVLVVDDESDSRELVAFVLEQVGARVTTAATADEALTALVRSQPDILLSDIGMPDMDGYMLMKQVRALPTEQGGQVRAIALTAYAGDFNQQQALQAGFQQHVSKPVEPEVLVKAITSLLSHT